MLKIEVLGSPVLRGECYDVSEFDSSLAKLVNDMFKAMQKAKGVGLAAPQIGINKRLFVTAAPQDENRVFINPQIVSYSVDMVTLEEGCLSVPGIWCDVKRPAKIVIKAFDLQGNAFSLKASGFLARVIQHEYDHLNGKIFTDYGDESVKKRVLKKFGKGKNFDYLFPSALQ